MKINNKKYNLELKENKENNFTNKNEKCYFGNKIMSKATGC